jgi:tetratricopeptide (TPR) repeat protein
LAMSDYFLHQIPGLLDAIQESLTIARELGQEWWESASLCWFGQAYVAAQSMDDASHYAEVADKMARQIGDPWLSFFPNQVLAQIATLQGDFLIAKERFQSALEAAQSINFKRGMGYTYSNLGDISYFLEEFVEAEQYHLQSLKIGQEIGQLREMLGDIYGIARVWAVFGRGSEAVELLAVVLQHPASEQTFLTTPAPIQHEAERLRAELVATLPPEEYASAWQVGISRKLEDVVAELLG